MSDGQTLRQLLVSLVGQTVTIYIQGLWFYPSVTILEVGADYVQINSGGTYSIVPIAMINALELA